MNSQKRLFEAIKSKLPKSVNLSDAIADLLGGKSDSAYRRIRGDKPLSFPELEKISNKYHVSIDEFLNFNTKQNVLFQFYPVSDADSYIKYMSQLSERFDVLASASEKELLFAAQDIPFYHFLKYHELAIFRIYAWHRTVTCNAESFSDFYNGSDGNTIKSLYEKIYLNYLHIPSTEVWTGQTVDTTVRLLEYYSDTGAFGDRDTALLLADQLANMLDAVKQLAIDGYKGSVTKTPFSMYACSTNVENDFMMTRNGEEWTCTMKLYAINRITSGNEFLCSETLKWIDSLKAKSILISGNTAFKERFHFFNSEKEKIQLLVNKITTN
ncbi:MAG: hypothetical protein LBV74_22680 [Tannerella sp.]|jgi:hypothetical protein|nr:hypothetical protein [Tannerella sp.]